LDEVCFSLILIPIVLPMTSSLIVIVSRFPLRVWLYLFEHAILLEMAYFIASPASYIDASF